MESARTTRVDRSLIRRFVVALTAPADAVPEESPLSPAVRRALPYALSVAAVALALWGSLALERHGFRSLEFSLLLFAVASTIWYPGIGPALVAVLLSALVFNYYFTEPRYTLIVRLADIPYYLAFLLFSGMLTWFSVIRRRAERQLFESREQLRVEMAERTQQASLLNLTHDTIFVRGLDDVITYWNRGAEELYGWTAEQALGKRSEQLFHTVYPVALDDIRAELHRSGRWEGELRKVMADGTPVVVASRWSLRRDEDGRPDAILETNNDVTERRRREEQIRGLNQQLQTRGAELEASNRELEAFAYSISHDLRAPLRHMVGFAELLQQHSLASLDEKSRRYMAIILEAAKKMGMLIDDLLAFSRTGRAEARLTTVSLGQVVGEVVDDLGPESKDRTVAWSVGALPDLQGDRSMLKLVFVNLIANALKFTRTRERAEIAVGSFDDPRRGRVVFVKDNGVGFDMKYANKLFRVFQRLHRTEEFEGTGIGLATVQRIVHRHGGEVWAESAVNGGAAFYVSFPRQATR